MIVFERLNGVVGTLVVDFNTQRRRAPQSTLVEAGKQWVIAAGLMHIAHIIEVVITLRISISALPQSFHFINGRRL